MIVSIEQLRPVLHELNMGEVVAVMEMEGGSSPVFRIDLADGERLVLKTYAEEGARHRTRKHLPRRSSAISRFQSRVI